MNLIVARSSTNNLPKVYAFNTFFYPKIMSDGHAGVKRWTRKVDVFSHDIILVPVHLGVHWCLSVQFRICCLSLLPVIMQLCLLFYEQLIKLFFGNILLCIPKVIHVSVFANVCLIIN